MYNIKDKCSYCADTHWFLKTCFAITILQEKKVCDKEKTGLAAKSHIYWLLKRANDHR